MTSEHRRNVSTNKLFSHYLYLCNENTRKDRKLEKLEKKIIDLKYVYIYIYIFVIANDPAERRRKTGKVAALYYRAVRDLFGGVKNLERSREMKVS